ncbi:PVC-type heme-binding CxxCH protein [Larkinella punicea]|uniref:Dehydrogenase n=1 Tax=Larkinella punicea TaxID=2315727 RepID=A0A368JJI5_9BACT|nr:PVC-type heme-binding CxxCH protein [Larkinella punicea]RCR67226.1 dehydrogenase [Larkinella punicea]
MKSVFLFLTLIILSSASFFQRSQTGSSRQPPGTGKPLRIKQDAKTGKISVFRSDGQKPIVVQNAKPDFRPYLHPINAPDGKGVLTEYSPGHHKHQTGLYWGFTRVNGRDYFHHPQGDYWRRVSATVTKATGTDVKWQTVYDLLDEKGEAVLRETQNWTMREQNGKFLLDLEWKGKAITDITIGKYDYGGLFLRMPWREGIKGEVINAARQRNEKAEGQRAMWVDAGMQVEGRTDLAHIAIFDHPENKGYPQTWRVDNQLGIGPARARTGDWKIEKGDTETIRHQVVVYTGELNDVELTKTWSEFSGNTSMYNTSTLWGLAQKEGLEAKFLTPQAAVESMTMPEGYKANVWASEPMMTQPMAFCWDDRGRLWVAENRDYESRGHGFSKAGNSRILILEDTNGDGVADKQKVFLDSIAFPSAIAVGFDGLFLGAPPNLLFVPDRNGDDVADVKDIEVRLTGWGIRDRHETLNSLHWGPDGWLYGLQGFATPSKVRKPNGKGKLYKHNDPFPEDILEGEGVDINGGVWRYHPTKDRFEVVAHGFSNPWGIDYDAKGQLIMTACVIPHLWHVVPGGIYHRQGGQHFNPYIYNDIKTIADHSHRSAHGGARVYQSDAFPASQQGRIFMANIHEHAILADVLEPKGSGFVGHHGADFLQANNAQWVGFSMEVGPDGGLYVLDWHDADICGKEVLNSETGRIFRIMPKNSLAENWTGRYSDLTKMTDQQLVGLQTVKSDWHARRARIILQNRAAKGKLGGQTHAQLRQLFETNANADWRLRALWTLHITGGFDEKALTKVLDDKDAYVRAWAVQMLCEDKAPPTVVQEKMVRMAREDPSAVVRLYLASALQRVDTESQWKIAGELMAHGEDKNDHNLPKMIWFGFEPLVKTNPTRALDLAARCEIPMVARFIARRIVDADQTPTLITALGKSPKTQVSLLEGMRDGLEGRTDLATPANWKTVYAKLKANPKTAPLAQQVGQQFGDTETARKSLATLKDRKAPLDQRLKALKSIAGQQRPELLAELPALLNEPNLRSETIRAIAGYDRESLGELLLARYADFSPADKLQVVQTMSSRPKYGWQLAQALKNNKIPKRDVPTYAARQLLRVVGSGFVEIWGPIEQHGIDEKAYTRYQKLLTDRALLSANTVKGRLVFQRTCGPCHKMYGEGGSIGPDITGSNRGNVDYLLSNILNPSGEIQDDYKMVVVTTRDGRTYSGNVAGENERQLTLRVVGQDAVVLNKSDVQSREVTPNSMMPTGLLDALTEDEVIDLVAFLRTTTPVKQAKK